MAGKHTRRDGDAELARPQMNSAAVLSDNEAYQADLQAELTKLLGKDAEKFVKADIGYPPYWKPNIAKGFRGVVLMRDQRNPKFHRYHIENTGPALDCRTGPSKDGEVVTVQPGQTFTISCWKALPLDDYAGMEVVVLATGKREGMPANEESDGQPRDMWEWELRLLESDNNLRLSQRKEDLDFLKETQRQARRKVLQGIAAASVDKRYLPKGVSQSS